MRLMPEISSGKVEFCVTHLPPWAENAVAIGSSEEAIDDLQAKTDAAKAAILAQNQARDAARSATLAARMAVDAMAAASAAIILQVRSKAETAGVEVYVLASLPPPADPSPIAAPGKPDDFGVALQQNGTLMLRWKCRNPRGSAGTLYQVYRRLSAEGKFEYLGSTGKKKYLDASIPEGTSNVTYQIQAVRSTAVGVFGEFNVNFGTNASGTSTAMLIQSPARLAA